MGITIDVSASPVRLTREDGLRALQCLRSRHGGGRMTANHRARGESRHTADEPRPLGTPVPSQRNPRERESARDGATRDWQISALGVPAFVTDARRFVRIAVDDSPRRDDIELIASELLTNAIRYTPSGAAGSLVTLRIRVGPGWARIEVVDQGDPSWTEPASPAEDEERGRGLAIVHLLADQAGHEPAAGGQVCWAEIRWDAGPVRLDVIRPA